MTPLTTSRAGLRIRPRTADGRGVELTIRLSRDPSPTLDRLDDLIVGGTLRLPIELLPSNGPTAAAPSYFRAVRFSLADRQEELASGDGKGEQPSAVLSCVLDRAATLDAVRAVAGRESSLVVQAVATIDGRGTASTCSASLVDLARDAAGSLDTWGRLFAPDPSTGALRPVPPRSRSNGSRGLTRAVRDVAPLDRGFASVATVATLSSIAAAPATAIAVHPAIAAVDVRLPADIVYTAAPRAPHLPLVDDETAELWSGADRVAPYWYLPWFSLVQPDPSRPVSASPFTFRFTPTGGHDIDGRPGLNATLTFTLKRGMSDAVISALGGAQARPVNFSNLAVSLSLPFRDSHGQLRRELFTATLVDNGDTIVATIGLLDNWARLAYGALAVDGFQPEPARVQIAGCFRGATVEVMDNDPFPVVLPRMHAVLPSHVVNRGDASVSFATGVGQVQFARTEAAGVRGARPVGVAQTLAIHSQLHSEVLSTALRAERVYSEQTYARTREVPCLFPCDRLGAFYIEETADGDVPVGCRDALKLGEIDYRLYAAVEDARLPRSVRVFRSLLQPGRFLIVPAAYRIARFGPDAGDRAYHPAIFLYSSLDAANPQNNRAALLATLGPAVAAHELEHVRELLRELAPSPVLQLITEIPATVSYAWSLANGAIVRDQQAIRRWDSFQLSMSVDVTQAPVLETMLQTNGVTVVATFELPDGTRLSTDLDLDLNAIVGPIGKTPAEVARASGGATLTNRIEVGLDVDDLLVVDDGAAPGQASIATIAVQKTLAPGESVTVTGDMPAAARLVPVATPKESAATLEEIRSFVEDVLTELAFINLVAFDNHNLSAIAIAARLKQTSDEYHVALQASDSVQVVPIVLPLTRYLAHPTLELQASVTRRDGTAQTTAWIDWPLETKGNVVGVSWEFLGLTN